MNEDTTAAPANALEKADLELGKNLAAGRHHPFLRWCCGIGKAGDQEPLYVAGAAALLAGLARGKPRAVRTGVAILAGVALSDVAKRAVKRLVTRSRPYHLLDGGTYVREPGGADEKCKQAFPSGHVAGSVAAALAVGRHYPETGAAPLAGAAVIGISRVLKGAHWPLDVAAGVVIGLAADGVCRVLMGRR